MPRKSTYRVQLDALLFGLEQTYTLSQTHKTARERERSRQATIRIVSDIVTLYRAERIRNESKWLGGVPNAILGGTDHE